MKSTDHYLERASHTWSEDSIRLTNTPTSSIRNTFLYVQEIGYFKTRPPYFTERANLNSFLIVYTLTGKGILLYEGKEYELHEKQVYFIDCRKHHEYHCAGEECWEFLWIHFYGNTALGYYEEFIRHGFHIITFEDSFFIESTLRRILSITEKKDVHSEFISSNLIVNLLTELLIRSSSEGLSLSIIPDNFDLVNIT